MSRTTFRRIARLEARQLDRCAPWHQIVLERCEEAGQWIAAMMASGEASAGDNFILTVIVDPPARENG